nr:hypothetical protein [Brucella anthropi]DAM62842.1 MAG TPA: hypothetical protein [Caudoviricetes sp.]
MGANNWQEQVAGISGTPSILGILLVCAFIALLLFSERRADFFFNFVGHALIGSYFAVPAMLIAMAMGAVGLWVLIVSLAAGTAGAVWSYRRSD